MTLDADRAAAGEINQLIAEMWLALEKQGPYQEEFELTGQQHAVLELIASSSSITPREISEQLEVTKAAISQHLEALEKLGYITRTRSESDRRVQVLGLTRKGEAYRDSLREVEQYTIDRYLTALSASDISEIVTALKKLKEALTSADLL